MNPDIEELRRMLITAEQVRARDKDVLKKLLRGLVEMNKALNMRVDELEKQIRDLNPGLLPVDGRDSWYP